MVLAINSTSEDFPTPVPPIRRIVCGTFALFPMLMIASLRDLMSLNLVRTDVSRVLLGLPGNQGVTGLSGRVISHTEGSLTKCSLQRCISRVKGGDYGTKFPD